MVSKILIFMLWFLVWLLLSWPPRISSFITGALVSAFVSFMTMDILVKDRPSGRSPLRYLWFVYYIIIFLWECLKANIDVAWRVLHPKLPIRPATIKIRTDLKSDIGLTFLANSITLTPGTTTIDVDKQNGYIYIHVLFLKEGCPDHDMRLPVVSKFERILKKVFE
jgi:multicomponent Na+:H+ antiporter subunit E